MCRCQGRVAVGGDADLVVWDPSATQTVDLKTCRSTRADVNVYDGLSLSGAATHVVYAGDVVVDDQGVCIVQTTHPASTLDHTHTPTHTHAETSTLARQPETRVFNEFNCQRLSSG